MSPFPTNSGRKGLLPKNPSISMSSNVFEPYRPSQTQHNKQMHDEFSSYNNTTKEHVLTRNAGRKNSHCLYCKRNYVKTKWGCKVQTYFMCDACKVPLCSAEMKGKRCFDLYHQETLGMPPGFMNRRGQKVYSD